MKRYWIAIIMVFVMLFATSCGNESGNTIEDSENKVEDSGNKVEDSGNKVEDSGNKVEDSGNKVEDSGNKENNKEEEKEPESKKIEVGKTITMKDGNYEIEFKLVEVVFQQEVYSNSDNMFASYFPDVDGESYIVAKLKIKNTGGDYVTYNIFDDIMVSFGGKYNYRMQQLDLESSIMSQYWGCDPLKTVDVYFVQSVPDDVKSMGCNITFNVGNTLYKY